MKKIILIFGLFTFAAYAFAGDSNDLTKTLDKLNKATTGLKNLYAEIEYLHAQTLFDTQTIRTGKIFYVKDSNNSALRINFLTMKQDQADVQPYKEDYIFDGKKLTRIDYQSKSAVTEEYSKDKMIDPFELVQDYFPIIGLSKPDEITQDFNSTLSGNVLKLVPKANTRYFKSYKLVEVTINPEINLPIVFKASTTDNEEITINLSKMDISTPIKKDVFEISIPKDFVQTQK